MDVNTSTQTIDNWVENVLADQESFMKFVETLKWVEKVPNYLRMFQDYEELKDKFIKEISKQTFIKSRRS